jgi:hypothetical protein
MPDCFLAVPRLLKQTFTRRWLLILSRLQPKPRAGGTHLVIFKPDGIGDFILATGAIRWVMEHENRPVVLLTSSDAFDLARTQFPDLLVHSLPGSVRRKSFDSLAYLKKAWQLASRYGGSELVCLRHSLNQNDHIVLRWLQPKRSFGTMNSPIAPALPAGAPTFTFSDPVQYPPARDDLPAEICAHRDVLRACYTRGEVAESGGIFPFLRVDRGHPTRRLTIFPSTNLYLRNFPLERLAAVVNRLDRNLYSDIAVCGGAYDHEQMQVFLNLLDANTGAHLLHTKSILEVISLINCSAAVLTMDSAPAHIAICCGTPSVSILAGGQYGHFAPYGNPDTNVWLSHRTECYGCNWQCPHPEPYCITRIEDQVIGESLTRLLSKSVID